MNVVIDYLCNFMKLGKSRLILLTSLRDFCMTDSPHINKQNK